MAGARIFTVTTAALLLAAFCAGEADAQRRRRGKQRRKPAPAAAAPSSTAPDSESEAPEAQGDAAMEITPAEAGADSVEAGTEPAASTAATADDASELGDPEQPAEPGQDSAELAALREEMAAVMDRLVQTRARVSMLGKSLFKTKVRIELLNETTTDPIASSIVVLLDGEQVFSGDASALDDDGYRKLFEGFAAPGPHVLTLEVEQRARDDDSYRYEVRDSFHFEVLREHTTALRLVLDDDSDMADDFPDDHSGEYEVQTRLEVRAIELGEDD